MNGLDPVRFEAKARDFLSSYVPFDGGNIFVAGGIFTRLYHNLPITDIDVYVNNDQSKEKAIENYLNAGYKDVSQYKRSSCGLYEFLHPDGTEIDLISFHEPKSMDWTLSFDFMHCMLALSERSSMHFFYGSGPFSHMINKNLVINPCMKMHKKSSNNNVIKRLKKYLDLGFTIDDKEMHVLYHILVSGSYEEKVLPY